MAKKKEKYVIQKYPYNSPEGLLEVGTVTELDHLEAHGKQVLLDLGYVKPYDPNQPPPASDEEEQKADVPRLNREGKPYSEGKEA